MCEFSNNYPVYEVDENDLLSFDEFCERKYHDPEVQKLGFFKVVLQKDVKRKTTLEELIVEFGEEVEGAVKKLVVCSGPVEGKGLYGHFQVLGDYKDQASFQLSASAFHEDIVKKSCCMKVFEKDGSEGYMEHFYSHIAKKAVRVAPEDDDVRSCLNQVPKWKAALMKRKAYQKLCSPKEKFEYVSLCMQTEEVDVAINTDQCTCKLCAYKFFNAEDFSDSPILYSSGVDETRHKNVEFTENFSMATLCYQNMLSMTDAAFDGISFPVMHIGTSHSFFPLHYKDYSLWSFNVLLYGGHKSWIVIPPQYVAKLTSALVLRGFGYGKTCINSLGHKFYIPTIQWLRKEDISFSVVIQREGEGVVLLPNAAHTGANLSHNWSQSCNFATQSWLPYGILYTSCTCLPDFVHAMNLTPMISVHAPHLLKAYKSEVDISGLVDDVHFQNSIVLPRQIAALPTHLAPSSSSTKKCEERLKCPVCNYSWRKEIRKRHVSHHLKRHHSDRLTDPLVEKYLKQNFPKKL